MRRVKEPFLGEYVTLAQKYPQIKSLSIEYEQMENRLQPGEGIGSLWESNCPPILPCKWKHCHDGGFAIENLIISHMIHKRLTEYAATLRCMGHEMFGARQRGSDCLNYLEFTAKIEYHDTPAQS